MFVHYFAWVKFLLESKFLQCRHGNIVAEPETIEILLTLEKTSLQTKKLSQAVRERFVNNSIQEHFVSRIQQYTIGCQQIQVDEF